MRNMKRKTKLFLAVDAFSGCGGLTEGLCKAGFKVIAGIELNKDARETYKINHPNVLLFKNIRSVNAITMMKKLKVTKGRLDLLAGCPPCQGFSRIRTRNSKSPARDKRNNLIFDFVRLVRGFFPKVIMLENVPGLETNWRLKKAEKILKQLGYYTDCKVVNAADYGVPQRRKRMILMASRLGPVSIPNKKYKMKTVQDAIKNIPAPQNSNNLLHKLLPKHNNRVKNVISMIPKNGGSRASLGDEYVLDCHRNLGNGFHDVYGRMKWNQVAPTLTRFCSNPSKGRFLHPSQNRVISLHEAALLQTFPRAYKFPIKYGRSAISSMIGEALPPLLAKRQAGYLLNHIKTANAR